jgi:hypothetical protein
LGFLPKKRRADASYNSGKQFVIDWKSGGLTGTLLKNPLFLCDYEEGGQSPQIQPCFTAGSIPVVNGRILAI